MVIEYIQLTAKGLPFLRTVFVVICNADLPALTGCHHSKCNSVRRIEISYLVLYIKFNNVNFMQTNRELFVKCAILDIAKPYVR